MFISLNKILPSVINKLNLKRPIDKIKAFKIWNEYIKKKNFHYNISPIYFRNSILTVSCDNSVITNEFYLKEKEILEEINKKEKIIKKIKFICS